MAIRLQVSHSVTSPASKSVEELIEEFGRIGGPTEHGWHTKEPKFRCWREYRLMSSGRRPPGEQKSDALSLGSLVHELLASYYRGDLEQWREDLLRRIADGGYAEIASEASRLFGAYLSRWRIDPFLEDGGKRIVDIERRIERQLPWGEPYTARVDMVLRFADGYWVVDHKTSSAMTVDFVEGWQTDPSIIGILWCALRFYRPLRGMIINGIVKTKEPQFDRFRFALDRRMVRHWLAMMRYKFAEEQLARLAGWPPNMASCIRRYGRCSYFAYCVYGPPKFVALSVDMAGGGAEEA